MKYKLTKVGNKFHLIEISTNFVISRSDTKKSLKPLKDRLEAGNGFAGKSPEFIAEKI